MCTSGSIPSVYLCLSEEWVGIHYDLSHIQGTSYSIPVARMRMWLLQAKRPSFSLQILSVFSLGLRPSWVVRRKQYTHHRDGGTGLKCGIPFSFLSPLLLSLYRPLSLSHLSLWLINSHYHDNSVIALHTVPMGHAFKCACVCVCVCLCVCVCVCVCVCHYKLIQTAWIREPDQPTYYTLSLQVKVTIPSCRCRIHPRRNRQWKTNREKIGGRKMEDMRGAR